MTCFLIASGALIAGFLFGYGMGHRAGAAHYRAAAERWNRAYQDIVSRWRP